MEREEKESPVAQEEMDDDDVRLLGLFFVRSVVPWYCRGTNSPLKIVE